MATRAATAMKVKVAINGFGRIGRNFLRCWDGRDDSAFEVVCVNDSGGVKQASHLLKYDSVLGPFDGDVKISGDTEMTVNGKKIEVVSSRDPTQLPWKDMGVTSSSRALASSSTVRAPASTSRRVPRRC